MSATSGGELFQRDDDRPETVRRRQQVYKAETAPIIDFYGNHGLLLAISATGSVDEVTQRAISSLESVSRS